jgi:paired amphipathic helix protein Sin3a
MFLEIMKSFKAETIDTPGVIQKVSELFRGHNNLILGFNTFLPPGYRIENSDLPDDQHSGPMSYVQTGPSMAALHAQQMMQQQHMMQGQPGVMLGPGGVPHGAMMDGGFFMGGQPFYDHQPHQYMMMMGGGPEAMQQQQLQQQQQGQPGQPVEFDHAISYVTRIKRRFANDAETYKAFLDILHTYQKEQKSIKEVLDQVSELFKDHPDLLKEFTYFLPDGVREKAKQEINKIHNRRRKEEQRRNEKNQQQKSAGLKPGKEGKDKGSSSLGPPPPPMSQKIGTSPSSANARRDRDLDDQDEIQGIEKDRSGLAGVPERGGINVTLGKIPRLEKRLFARIKSALSTRERWGEFLKCLELFSQEILSRQELIAVAADMFASNTELLDEFDRLLASRGATDDPTEDAWFSIPLSDIDFSQTRRATPSYRSLPPNYPKPPCSERTALCRMVLNDTWVAVPTGSEDFSFKSMRKNQYEEALFKCEDDRYELDMVIDSNLSTIRALEPLALEIEGLKEQANKIVGKAPEGDVEMGNTGASSSSPTPTGLQKFKLDRRTLSVIHLKAIARVYGDRSTEMFELLRKSPASAIPVILARLKTKDEEWRRQRTKLNEGWKETLEKNYIKSLDHRSFYFKQNEKKLLTAKTMIMEAKDSLEKSVKLEFPDAFAHRHASTLILLSAEKNLNKADYEKCSAALERLVSRLVGVKSFGGKMLTSTKVGTKVLSRYGLGTISTAAAANSPLCEVKLVASGAVVRVPKDDLYEAAPFNPKEMAATGPSSSALPEVVYIGQTGYLFLRFYQILCDRLARAEALCSVVEREQRTQVKHVIDRNGSGNAGEKEDSFAGAGFGVGNGDESKSINSLFARCMELIKQFVRGQLDGNKFEDEAYTLVGPHSYFLFTMDKLLTIVVRSIQGMINEDRAVKVVEAASKYQEKKYAYNAVELYRATSEALCVGNACAAAKLRLVSGATPFAPPTKKLADATSDTSSSTGDIVLAAVDALWETPPHLVVELMDSIPQNVNFGVAGSGRSLSPVAFDADGVALATEMGELEFALPIKIEGNGANKQKSISAQEEGSPLRAKKASEASGNAGANVTLSSAPTAASVSSVASAGETLIISAFVVEKLPGSDDVFRRINAFKQDSSSTEKDWWKSSSIQIERTLSPVPGEESASSNEDGPPAGSKRLRGAGAAEEPVE